MNHVFLASTQNEIEKLSGKKKVWMLPIIALALTGLSLWGLLRLKTGTGILPVSGGEYPIMVLGWFTSLILPLFIIMAGADVFSGEFTERTMKLALLKPISRLKLYMSKQAALAVYIVGTLAMVFLLSTVGALLLGNSVHLSENLVAYGAAALPMLLIAFGVGLIAQFFKSGSGVMVFSILAYAVSKAIGVLFPGLSDYLIPSYMNWHTLFIGGGAGIGRIILLFMFMISYSIIILTTGYYLFEKKEL